MAKIIQFPTTQEARELLLGRNKPVSEPEEKKPPKKAIIQSIMPNEPFPVGHEDLRPLLQRDGLVLLSWAIWQDWYENESYVKNYIVTWITSNDKGRHYATRAIERPDITEAMPERQADYYFYKGIYGRYWGVQPLNRDIADYVYLVAPFDLTGKTVPRYIKLLKALGSTVNFDIDFSLGGMRKTEAEKFIASTQVEKTS